MEQVLRLVKWVMIIQVMGVLSLLHPKWKRMQTKLRNFGHVCKSESRLRSSVQVLLEKSKFGPPFIIDPGQVFCYNVTAEPCRKSSHKRLAGEKDKIPRSNSAWVTGSRNQLLCAAHARLYNKGLLV